MSKKNTEKDQRKADRILIYQERVKEAIARVKDNAALIASGEVDIPSNEADLLIEMMESDVARAYTWTNLIEELLGKKK